jgi:hypothetical protein
MEILGTIRFEFPGRLFIVFVVGAFFGFDPDHAQLRANLGGMAGFKGGKKKGGKSVGVNSSLSFLLFVFSLFGNVAPWNEAERCPPRNYCVSSSAPCIS